MSFFQWQFGTPSYDLPEAPSDGLMAFSSLLSGVSAAEPETLETLEVERPEESRKDQITTPSVARLSVGTIETAASEALQVAPVTAQRWQLSSANLVSHWMPFSAYEGNDLSGIASLDKLAEHWPAPVHDTRDPDPAPEGFRVLSVRHHESNSDPSDISVGKYFYFDASQFPSFEFSSHPCYVEQWRQGTLRWSGQVKLTLGGFGSADLAELSEEEVGRFGVGRKEPRSFARAGDFELEDLISVVAFHRDLAPSVGNHLEFERNLYHYQRSCMGKRILPEEAVIVHDLGDLGQRICIETEVDQQELAAIRMSAIPAIEDEHSAALSRENSLALAVGYSIAVQPPEAPSDVAEEGSALAVRKAKRTDLLSAR
ncbi:unnamed protein product [Effrenium voratum]|nr:unnamed protein product [Effrenium voratum]